jgi:hypothetical protein
LWEPQHLSISILNTRKDGLVQAKGAYKLYYEQRGLIEVDDDKGWTTLLQDGQHHKDGVTVEGLVSKLEELVTFLSEVSMLEWVTSHYGWRTVLALQSVIQSCQHGHPAFGRALPKETNQMSWIAKALKSLKTKCWTDAPQKLLTDQVFVAITKQLRQYMVITSWSMQIPSIKPMRKRAKRLEFFS